MIPHRRISIPLLLVFVFFNLGWNAETCKRVAWTAVNFIPEDLAMEIRENHKHFDAGISLGLAAPGDWLQGPPGHLEQALVQTALSCERDLRKPVPLKELVKELGILSVLVFRANDPIAVAESDSRESRYRDAYSAYVFSTLERVRIVYYGWDANLNGGENAPAVLAAETMSRSRKLYPFIGAEFFRTGRLRNWREFDDRSIAFGVSAISLSRGMTDFINLCRWIWKRGGGRVVPPRPTPQGHHGPVIIPAPHLEKGFEKIQKEPRGAPVLPQTGLNLPPP